MVACYAGLETMMGPDREQAVRAAVADKDRRSPANLNHVITMMESLREISGAGTPVRMEQQKKTGAWDADPDAVIARIVAENADTPGYYAFGVSLVTGYHTAMLLLDLSEPAQPRLFFLDQVNKGPQIYGQLRTVFEEYAAKAEAARPGYSPLISQIWPLYPPPTTVLPLGR